MIHPSLNRPPSVRISAETVRRCYSWDLESGGSPRGQRTPWRRRHAIRSTSYALASRGRAGSVGGRGEIRTAHERRPQLCPLVLRRNRQEVVEARVNFAKPPWCASCSHLFRRRAATRGFGRRRTHTLQRRQQHRQGGFLTDTRGTIPRTICREAACALSNLSTAP